MKSLLLIGLCWLLAVPSWASMVLDRSIIEFTPGAASRQDVMVTNPDQETLFVEVTVLTVDDPGTEGEQRTEVRDPASIGFIATPNRLAVPPGGQRLVRLVNLNGHGKQEQVYRVNLTPVEAPREQQGEEPRLGLRVLVGYQLLVFIAPEQVQAQLLSQRQGDVLRFENAGNVNVLLSDGVRCPQGVRDSDDPRCQPVRGRRLYPGNVWTVPVSDAEQVRFRTESAGRRQQEWFD